MAPHKRFATNVVCTRNSRQWSRMEIMSWINEMLVTDLRKIEDLCTGAAYCNLMDILFGDVVKMHKVKFVCNQPTEFIENFRVLQQSFNAVHVDTPIDIEQLVKGRFQDNYAFAQWFKLFFEANFEQLRPGYNARAARNYMPIGIGQAELHSSIRARSQSPYRPMQARPQRLSRSRTVQMPAQTAAQMIMFDSGRPMEEHAEQQTRGRAHMSSVEPTELLNDHQLGIMYAPLLQRCDPTRRSNRPSASQSMAGHNRPRTLTVCSGGQSGSSKEPQRLQGGHARMTAKHLDRTPTPLSSEKLTVPQVKQLPYLILPIPDAVAPRSNITYIVDRTSREQPTPPLRQEKQQPKPTSKWPFGLIDMLFTKWRPQ